jgi:S1-C subfamily serine protease
VTPGSAAAAAGLQGTSISRDGGIVSGDIIVAVEGKPVDSVGKLLARLDDFKVGDTIRLGIVRNGARTEVSVTLQPGV